jgi:hypothetical protein
VLDYPFRYSYDLIIVHGVLQFIDKTKQPHTMTEPNSKGITHKMPQPWSPPTEK